MEKKKTQAAKKQTPEKKKAQPPVRSNAPNAKNEPSAVRNASSDAPVQKDTGIDDYHVNLLPPNLIADTIESINSTMDDFSDVADNNLTSAQRRRKIGAGIRNYGFIEKVTDLAEASPQFTNFFRPVDLRNAVRNLDACRDILVLLQSFSRIVSNTMLVYSNEAFTMSLIFYNTVKEMSRRGDPKAMELFRMLQPFFRRQGRPSAEPTEKELERDLHALIHGKKDGKIVVENITPAKAAGARKVVDDVYKGRAAVKESVEASED